MIAQISISSFVPGLALLVPVVRFGSEPRWMRFALLVSHQCFVLDDDLFAGLDLLVALLAHDHFIPPAGSFIGSIRGFSIVVYLSFHDSLARICH